MLDAQDAERVSFEDTWSEAATVADGVVAAVAGCASGLVGFASVVGAASALREFGAAGDGAAAQCARHQRSMACSRRRYRSASARWSGLLRNLARLTLTMA